VAGAFGGALRAALPQCASSPQCAQARVPLAAALTLRGNSTTVRGRGSQRTATPPPRMAAAFYVGEFWALDPLAAVLRSEYAVV